MTLYMVDPKRRCFITGLDGAEVMMGFGIWWQGSVNGDLKIWRLHLSLEYRNLEFKENTHLRMAEMGWAGRGFGAPGDYKI